jgi:hypothetical protein
MSEQRDENGSEEPVNGDRSPKNGRFKPGNVGGPGRPKGSPTLTARNCDLRIAIINAAEAAGQEVDPTHPSGIEAYLKHLAQREPKSFSSLLGRTIGQMPVRVALPAIEKPSDLVAASSAVAKAMSDGEISPGDASAISGVVANVGRMVEINELAERIAALEQAAQSQRKQP